MSRGCRCGASLIMLAFLLVLGGAPTYADDAQGWPQFRGPDRNGISQETGILKEWPEAGPKELWRREIGVGYSAPSIADGRLYTMYSKQVEVEPAESSEAAEQAPEQSTKTIDVAAAFDAASGNQLWQVEIGEAVASDWGDGPMASPTVSGPVVYVLGSLGKLLALATADGTKRWEVDVCERFGCQRPHFGFSGSVLVHNDTLIFEAGGPDNKAVAGLDTATGETRWTVGDPGRGLAYNSVLPIDLLGQHQILFQNPAGLVSLTASGEQLWSHSLPVGEVHAMPIFLAPDKIFACGVEGVGSHLIKVTKGEDGMTTEEVWSNQAMRNHFSSSVAVDGHLYGFDNATLRCINADTGEVRWSKRGLGKGSLILADGHLIVLSDKGRLVLLEATAAGYKEQGRVQALRGRSWTAPALADGLLYVRNHTEMVCYDMTGKAGTAESGS